MPISRSRMLVASFLAALAVAVLAYLVAIGAFLVSYQLQPAALPAAAGFFLLPAAVLAVLLWVAGFFGAFENAVVALIAGLVLGVVAAFVGNLLLAFSVQHVITADGWASLASSLLGEKIPFWIAAGVGALTGGHRVYAAAVRFASGPSRLALVRLPAADVQTLGSVDVDRLDQQWDAYVAALGAAGWTTAEVAFQEAGARSVFVGDWVVALDGVAVLGRLDDSRASERDDVEQALGRHGATVRPIEAPGVLDAADVVVAGGTVYVSAGGASNGEGIRQLRAIAREHGADVVAVSGDGTPLSAAVSALPDGTLLGHIADGSPGAAFRDLVTVRAPEEAGARVVALDDESVLVSEAAPATAALLAELGFRVVSAPLDQFDGLGRGPGALSARLP